MPQVPQYDRPEKKFAKVYSHLDGPASYKQISYIKQLCLQRKIALPESLVDVSKERAALIIDKLKNPR